jgi:hypothetical protein
LLSLSLDLPCSLAGIYSDTFVSGRRSVGSVDDGLRKNSMAFYADERWMGMRIVVSVHLESKEKKSSSAVKYFEKICSPLWAIIQLFSVLTLTYLNS